MNHYPDCYLGGYRGPTKCCEGNCRHRVNCSCPAGETMTPDAIAAKIGALGREMEYWQLKLKPYLLKEAAEALLTK